MSNLSRNLTETEKLQMVMSHGNFFGGDDDENDGELRKLQATNRGLKKRVNKLQDKNRKLKAEWTRIAAENQKVDGLRAEIEELNARIVALESEHSAAIQAKDREIIQIQQKFAKTKHRLQADHLNLSREYEEKMRDIADQNSSRGASAEYGYGDDPDTDILDIIEECGDDVERLKRELYTALECMKMADE